MTLRPLLGSILALATLGAPALAQAPAPPPDTDQSTVVEGLEVIAKIPGPPLWKATKGSSELVIIGSVSPIAHQLEWNSRRVERALDGATLLLMPAKPKAGAGDVAMFYLRDMGKLKTKDLEAELTPAQRQWFAALVQVAHKKPDRYKGWKPAAAGFMLLADYQEAAGLSEAKPGSTIEKLAKDHHVPVQAAGEFKLSALGKMAAGMTPAQNSACFDAFLTEVESEAPRPQALGQAWAAGNLPEIKRLYTIPARLEPCVAQGPGGRAVLDEATEQSTRTLLRMMNIPGRTVAVVDLSQLLRANGVLDRLQAAGATISLPPQ